MIIERPYTLLQTFSRGAPSRFCLSGDNFICDLLQRKNALYPILKARGAFGHTCFVPARAKTVKRYFRQWQTQALDATLATPKIAFTIEFNQKGSSLPCGRGRTDLCEDSPIFTTDSSTVPLISGEYSSSNPPSSWSDGRRAPACANIISWPGWLVAKVRTLVFAENRNSRGPLCFPMAMAMASVLLYQICVDWLVITTDPVR